MTRYHFIFNVIIVIIAVLCKLSSSFSIISTKYRSRSFNRLTMQNQFFSSSTSSKFAAIIAVSVGLSSSLVMPIPSNAAPIPTKSTTVSTPSKKLTPAQQAKKNADEAYQKELDKLGLKSTEGEPSKRLGAELALEGALSNQLASKTRLDEVTSEVNSLKSKLATVKADYSKALSNAQKLESKVSGKNIDKDVKRLTLEEAGTYRSEAAKIKTQLVSLENSIIKDTAEITSLKKRISDSDKYIKDKVLEIKQKRFELETAKKVEDEKAAVKLAQDKAAAKTKAKQLAQKAIDLSKREVTLAEVALKTAQAKLVGVSKAVQTQATIEKKVAASVATLEAKLKKEKDMLAVEDKRLADITAKRVAGDTEIKKSADNLAAKKLAYAAALESMKAIK